MASDEVWPALPLEAWRETYDTLHMWMQIVGKIRLALSPMVNHWWHTAFYLTSRGLTTSPMPYGERTIEIAFDFIDHNLSIDMSDGQWETIPLTSRPVADFYIELMATLQASGVDVKIWPKPVEVTDAVPFPQDQKHAKYDREYAHRAWQVLMQTDEVLKAFRGHFLGKCSPVHFFWGSFDLAVTRFSGRKAPEMPNADPVTREAYSHEVISHGFWPGGVSAGGVALDEPVFYSYAAPEPAGFKDEIIRPKAAHYHPKLSEFVLSYDTVRQSNQPTAMLMEFFQSTYDAGANRGQWDRPALER